MVETQKFPTTLKERLALGEDMVQFPASFQEFVELIKVCEYPIEFQNETIIARSIASEPHEQIVANMLGIFFAHFRKNKLYKRFGSNRHVWLEQFECAYSSDASIIKGKPDIYEYAKGKTANKNPWLIVEVMSPSTRGKDLGEKLPRFKKTKSVEYIIYVEQDDVFVTVYKRIENSSRWESADYDDLDHSFEIENKEFLLSDIYDVIH